MTTAGVSPTSAALGNMVTYTEPYRRPDGTVAGANTKYLWTPEPLDTLQSGEFRFAVPMYKITKSLEGFFVNSEPWNKVSKVTPGVQWTA